MRDSVTVQHRGRTEAARAISDDPLWYKDAIIYEVHVKSFYDSNHDGIGDFQGLIEKLDYLVELGVNCIWLLPFFPSPLRDDGYDIADYRGIHPQFGTRRDFRQFIREAHERGIRVIIELVINHTSDHHAWFQAARKAPSGTSKRDFYVWSDTDQRYAQARIIFRDFEPSNWTWDPVAQAYYWHRFFHHQPDLNFENPKVRKAITRVMRFWLDLGVDGLRLDAIPYLCEREGTNCENLPETHEVLKMMRSELDAHYRNRMFLAEANQWPTDVRPYFGAGDECHMAFHFPLMPRIFIAIRQEDRLPITDIMERTPSIPENCQWALFLRNHDELTLEMVTDEERDYMYFEYAKDPRMRLNLGIRRRLAPLLDNGRRRMELLNSILFSFPGTPIIYYGDEIGMGDNIFLGDRNGVRTPMQWSADRNGGFSRAEFAQLYAAPVMDAVYGYQSVNVDSQLKNPSSFLHFMKRLIALRKRYSTFGRGSIEFLAPENRKALAYIRRDENHILLVLANLSRYMQPVELNLEAFEGYTPIELFGRVEFPRIGKLPYFITLSPHGFCWFELIKKEPAIEPQAATVSPVASTPETEPVLEWDGNESAFLSGPLRRELEHLLPHYIKRQRWFGEKSKEIEALSFVEAEVVSLGTFFPRFVRLEGGARSFVLWYLIEVVVAGGERKRYFVPLALLAGQGRSAIQFHHPEKLLATLRSNEEELLLVDGLLLDDFCRALLLMVRNRREMVLGNSTVTGKPRGRFLEEREHHLSQIPVARVASEQSNSSVIFSDRYILKIYRGLEQGINPDVELNLELSDAQFQAIPMTFGTLECVWQNGASSTIGLLQEFCINQGTCWDHAVEEIRRYLEACLVGKSDDALAFSTRTVEHLRQLIDEEVPETFRERLGPYLHHVQLLGTRTAELHQVLAARSSRSEFQPEPFTAETRERFFDRLETLARGTFAELRAGLPSFTPDVRKLSEQVLATEARCYQLLHEMQLIPITVSLIRIHGDYHLAQVLRVPGDFIILDFEGEPARLLSERRERSLALRDVTGMLRSFRYAVHTALAIMEHTHREELERSIVWADIWERIVCAQFIKAYLATAERQPFHPREKEAFWTWLHLLMVEKALYEVHYELNHRPDWLKIPLQGLAGLLG